MTLHNVYGNDNQHAERGVCGCLFSYGLLRTLRGDVGLVMSASRLKREYQVISVSAIEYTTTKLGPQGFALEM
jgi:hypothetical protein